MFWRRRKPEDFQAELDAHLQLEADELRSEGASPGESYAQAQRALGNRTLVEERFYESSPWMWLEQTLRDLRYAVRSLRKDSAFSAVAVLVLALGIGGNIAVFSLVNALLLKPLVIRDPERVVGCYSVDAHHPDRALAFSYPNYADLRAQNAVFSSLAAHDIGGVMVTSGGTSRPAPADLISSNFFETLGAPLFKGRSFTPEEERPDSDARVVILSYSFWQRIGADPAIVGMTLRLSGKEFTVVGIAPQHFTGTMALLSMDLYLPLGAYATATSDSTHARSSLRRRDNNVLMLVGRLKPGLTPRSADAMLVPVAAQLEKAFPAENRDRTLLVRPLSRLGLSPDPPRESDLSVTEVPVALLLSMGAVVLAIASLNLAGLTLARANARHREIAIRLAIGANRGRIVRQLATEGFLLACLGGTAGLAVAPWCVGLIFPSLSARMHVDLVYSAQPDIRVVAATLAFCLLSTLIFSLWPALKISKPDVASGLKTRSGEEERGRLFSRRNVLVIAQLSLSLMLLSAAGLFLRSGLRAANFDPGFSTRQQVLLEVDPSFAGYDETRGREFFATLLTRLRGIPGVESAALAEIVPFGNHNEAVGIRPSGGAESANLFANFNSVTPEYFQTFGIPLLQGRTFYPSETGVAIMDQLAAQRLWPGQDAVGKRVAYGTNDVLVVGIAGDVHGGIVGGGTVLPHLYVPFAQHYYADMNVHLKIAALGPDAQNRLFDRIRREVSALDNRVPIMTLTGIPAHMATSMDFWLVRMGTRVLAAFAGIALLMAVIGLYGTKAYTVARRTREIGIRIAVGADPYDVLAMILREGLLTAAAGVGVGLMLALGLGRFLAGMLYDVRAADVVVLSSAGLLLLAVAALASFVPARRAARIDPMLALRND